MPLISGQLKPGSFNQVIDMLHLDFDIQTFDDELNSTKVASLNRNQSTSEDILFLWLGYGFILFEGHTAGS